MAVKLSDRAKIARQFEMWCEEHGMRLCAQAMMAFLDSVGVFNEENVLVYLKSIRKDNLSRTGIKKFEKSKDDPKERKGKKK